jgi:hypothetical protein
MALAGVSWPWQSRDPAFGEVRGAVRPGMARPRDEDLPRPLRRSPAKAKRLFREVRDDARERYGDDERAYRTAYAALKHSFERVEGRWVEKEQKGPSDPQAAEGGSSGARGPTPHLRRGRRARQHEGELYERARRLGVKGRSGMTKEQLAAAIARAQD